MLKKILKVSCAKKLCSKLRVFLLQLQVMEVFFKKTNKQTKNVVARQCEGIGIHSWSAIGLRKSLETFIYVFTVGNSEYNPRKHKYCLKILLFCLTYILSRFSRCKLNKKGLPPLCF